MAGSSNYRVSGGWGAVGGECDNLTTATATTFSYGYNFNVLDWLSNRDDKKHNIIIRILHF